MSGKEALSKEVFEVYMKLNKESLDDLKKSTSLIFHKLDEQSKVLVRNTATVEDHRRRSDNLEERQAEFLKAVGDIRTQLHSISGALATINVRTDAIEKDIEPIQAHVDNVHNITNFLNSIYANRSGIAKTIIFAIVISTTVYYGIRDSGFIMRLFK